MTRAESQLERVKGGGGGEGSEPDGFGVGEREAWRRVSRRQRTGNGVVDDARVDGIAQTGGRGPSAGGGLRATAFTYSRILSRSDTSQPPATAHLTLPTPIHVFLDASDLPVKLKFWSFVPGPQRQYGYAYVVLSFSVLHRPPCYQLSRTPGIPQADVFSPCRARHVKWYVSPPPILADRASPSSTSLTSS